MEESILQNLVRLGTVMSVDRERRTARVKYQDTDLQSGDLPVLINHSFFPDYDGTQRTEYQEGGSGFAEYERHYHEIRLKPWLPKVNEQVLVLYLPVRNADGFILGSVQPWQ